MLKLKVLEDRQLWDQLQRHDDWAWYRDDVMVYVMTSCRYQAVTRHSQLSPEMIDVAVSSEVTDQGLLWEIQTVNYADSPAIRRVHPTMSDSIAERQQSYSASSRLFLQQPATFGRSVKVWYFAGHLRVENQLHMACRWRATWVSGQYGRAPRRLD